MTRILTWARFRDRATNTDFVHVNTHFDHESEQARVRSAEMLADLVAGDQFADVPVVVTGDFNAPVGSPAWQALVTRGPLVDLWETADQRVTPAWGSFPDYGERVEDGERIDWMLASPGVRAEMIGIGAVPVGEPAPSDHAPIQALIRLS